MSMLMSNSLGMPVSLCGGSSFFGIFSKMFSEADLLSLLSLFSSSSTSALCVLLKGLRFRKRRAFFKVERFDLWGGKGRRFDFPFWFWWEETTTHDAHVVSIIVAFVVLQNGSLRLCYTLCASECVWVVICVVILLLVSPLSFLSRCTVQPLFPFLWRKNAGCQSDRSIEGRMLMCGAQLKPVNNRGDHVCSRHILLEMTKKDKIRNKNDTSA